MPKKRIPSKHEQALLELLCIEQEDVKKHSNTVYEWKGLFLEILTKEQMLRRKIPASWYVKLGDWRVREMGDKSEIVRKIRGKK